MLCVVTFIITRLNSKCGVTTNATLPHIIVLLVFISLRQVQADNKCLRTHFVENLINLNMTLSRLER